MLEEKLEIRGIARKEIIIYLQQLGATSETTDSTELIFKGNYWSCHVSEEDSFQMFQSIIPKVHLRFIARDKQILETVLKNFRKKTFRAGG